MVALTLFPTTSLLTVAMRWGATVVPLWQLILSWVILAGCAGFGYLGCAQGVPPGHAAVRTPDDPAKRLRRHAGAGVSAPCGTCG